MNDATAPPATGANPDSRYHKVSPKFWTTVQAEAWSEDARTLALYLLTCPHRTTEGLFRLPKAYILDDLDWTSKRLTEPFAELLARGFIDYDEQARWVLLVGALKYNAPENPNQAKAAAKRALECPEGPLTSHFRRLAERYAQRLAEQLPEGFGKGYAQPLALTQALTPPQSLDDPPAERVIVERVTEAEFDAWWELYPKKVNKKAAEAKYRAARKSGVAAQTLIDGLKRAIEHWRIHRTDRQYIPGPDRWLNAGRWADEYDIDLNAAPTSEHRWGFDRLSIAAIEGGA